MRPFSQFARPTIISARPCPIDVEEGTAHRQRHSRAVTAHLIRNIITLSGVGENRLLPRHSSDHGSDLIGRAEQPGLQN
jgi:hypothetical protein